MKKNDDVFFFTLIDFLIQVFFFGLLLYVATQVALHKKNSDTDHKDKDVAAITRWTGFSTLTELTDYLTNLAPPTDFRGWADFMSQNDLNEVKQTVNWVNQQGGIKVVTTGFEKYQASLGLPSCVTVRDDKRGKDVLKSVATFSLGDDQITLLSSTPDFDGILPDLKTTQDAVKVLSLADFVQRFQPLRSIHPSCTYYVDIVVNTKLLAPYTALERVFSISKRT